MRYANGQEPMVGDVVRFGYNSESGLAWMVVRIDSSLVYITCTDSSGGAVNPQLLRLIRRADAPAENIPADPWGEQVCADAPSEGLRIGDATVYTPDEFGRYVAGLPDATAVLGVPDFFCGFCGDPADDCRCGVMALRAMPDADAERTRQGYREAAGRLGVGS